LLQLSEELSSTKLADLSQGWWFSATCGLGELWHGGS